VIERNPNEPDLQYAVNLLAGMERFSAWATYPPFFVISVAVPMVYRFRVGVADVLRLSPWAAAIHARYEHALRAELTGSVVELYEWLSVGAAQDAFGASGSK